MMLFFIIFMFDQSSYSVIAQQNSDIKESHVFPKKKKNTWPFYIGSLK